MSQNRPPTVATGFAQALRAAGVQRVYGLPGEDHLRLLDALATEGIAYVGAREEGAAAIMATAEAQATRSVGVLLVTLAPGITNAINGIAHAWLDHVPLLVVTGQHAPERAPVIVRQSLDTPLIVQGVCKATLTASARIHQVLARALDTAMAAPSGPVYLELRDDIAAATPVDEARDWPLLHSRTTQLRAGGTDFEFDSSHRPTVIVGGNCPTDPSTRAVLQTVHAPLFTSPSAMGITSYDNDWFAGTFMNGNFEAAILDRCDLIITIGLDAKDFFNAEWRYAAPVVAINPYPDTQRFVPTQRQIVGDVAPVLETLSCETEWNIRDVENYRASVEGPFALHGGQFTIPTALRLARRLLPPETRVAVDAGFGKPLTSYLWSAPQPDQYFTAHGLSTMGYAIPAANALAFADQPVVAFMGDGSLLMRASELTVAAEHNLAPIYIAWMDGSLAQIETKQIRQRLRPVGARVPQVCCARVAEAFGATGCDVDSLADFGVALQDALERKGPTLIGAHVDQSCRGEWYELMRG